VCVCGTQRAFCAYCSDRIWGLGRQGFKCINCKLLVHKKCHKLLKLSCGLVAVSIDSCSYVSCQRGTARMCCPAPCCGASDSSLALDYCARYQLFACIYVYVVHLPLSTGQHSISRATQQQTRSSGRRMMGQTDGRMDHCIEPACSIIVCLLDTAVSATEAAVPIEMPFGLWTRLGPRNHVLDGLPGLTRRS